MNIDKEDYEESKAIVREKYSNDINIENIIQRADEYEESNERLEHKYKMLEMDYYRLEHKYNKLLKECGKELQDTAEIEMK